MNAQNYSRGNTKEGQRRSLQKRNQIVIKREKTTKIIDATIPGDNIIIDKEKKKIAKYQNLKESFRDFKTFKKII